jgi:two-component system NtrC family sensor kinase
LGIRISDIDNTTLYSNQTLLDIFGYENMDELKSTPPQEYYSPESYADYLKMMGKYGRGEIIPNKIDIDIIRKDGAIRHLQALFKEVFWDGKQQYQSLYNDITENKKIEVALRESEEKYRTIFESANDIIMLLDAKGKILDVNGRLTDIGGYERDELIGKNVSELAKIISVKSLPIVVANLQKIVAGSGIVTYQVEMLKKNREPVTVEINGVAIRKEGKVVSILAVLKDITERNRSELQIRESEEKYRNIFESANDIILLLDNKGKILDVNRRLTDIGGYEPDELIGKNVSELKKIISKKSLPIIVTNLMKRVAGLGVSTYQVEMVKKNREPVTVEINAVPIRKDGKIAGDLAILRDITERRKSELQIREQKALTDRILKSIPNVVAVVGRDQRIIMVNKAFEHTFELGEGQAEGKNIEKFIPVPHLVDTISQVLASDETQSQVEFRMKQGVVVKIWVADIISMQQNEVLIVLRDITEERELQERLYLTDRLASVGEMAAGIAHELNNPLTGVVALSQLLLENGVPDEMKEDMIAISKEGQRAAEVVRNLLSFARSHTLSASSTQINTVIKEVLNLRAYEHKVNNITVTTNLTPDLPEIMTDRFQMQQVFLNIILNAEHAMIDSNGRGSLRVTTEQNTGIIKISFTNDGPAIPPDIINRIFDPFFTTKDVGKGTGLGLSICYGIVTHQGGRIYAQSQEGKGATFIIELPIKAH